MIAALATVSVLTTIAPEDVAARTMQQLRNAGELRVGIVPAPPWAFRDDGGQWVGFEIDVGRQLATDLGVEVEFVVYRFDELVPAIESGEIDLVVSGLTITPERALHVNFSRPHSIGGIAIATNLTTTGSVTRFEDLSDGAYTVGAVEDSVAARIAAQMLPDAEFVEFDQPEQAAEALARGDIDAYLEEEPAPTFLSLEYPGLIDVPIGRPLLETRTGFAIAKGDADFVAFLNAWIEAREADTWLPGRQRYWFESLRWRSL